MLLVSALCVFPLFSPLCPVSSLPADPVVHISHHAGWSWEDCGTPTDLVSIKSIEVSPSPPVPGKNMTVTIVGEIWETVEDGAYTDVHIKIGTVEIAQKKYDLCELAEKYDVGVTCPVEPGSYSVSKTLTMPQEIPRTKFNIQALGYSKNEEGMFCVKMMANFAGA